MVDIYKDIRRKLREEAIAWASRGKASDETQSPVVHQPESKSA